MERLIRYGTITDDPLYNCSARTPEMIEKTYADPDPIYGSCCFGFGAINLILFMLCIKVMLEPTHFIYPAYKIMIAISCCDMLGIVYNSLSFGIAYYFGMSFCDAPNFIYIAGAVGTSTWITGSLLSSILIINRLVELKSAENKLIVNIFNGQYTSLVMLVAITFGIYCFIYHPPTLLDPKSGLTFWDPQIFKNAASQYFNTMLLFNNTIVVSFNSILSIVLCFYLSKQLEQNFGSMIDRRRQLTLFFQCLAIVTLCNIAALMYDFNFFFFTQCPPLLQKIAGNLYQLCTNLPPYIYLILNRSIRQGIIKMITRYNPKPYFTTSVKTTSQATWFSGGRPEASMTTSPARMNMQINSVTTQSQYLQENFNLFNPMNIT